MQKVIDQAMRREWAAPTTQPENARGVDGVDIITDYIERGSPAKGISFFNSMLNALGLVGGDLEFVE